jgi:uncharacterized protein
MARSLLLLELSATVVLLTLALLWNAWRGLGLWHTLQWSGRDNMLGLLAAVPLLLMIPLLEMSWTSSLPFLRHLNRDLRVYVLPLVRHLRLFEVVVVACLAGLSEEVFFRGVLQREIGIGLASLAFGLLHALSLAYVIWATVVGIYLGYLFQWSGNLWLPIVAHSVVDFIGLWYLRYSLAPRVGQDVQQDANRDVR